MCKKYNSIPILIYRTKEEKKVFSPIDYYLQRINDTRENLILIIITHLLTEFIVNQMLESKHNTSGKLFKDKSYSYKVKLMYDLKLIPEDSFRNLVALNKLRNQYAHQLNPPKDKLKIICEGFTFCELALGEEKLEDAVGDYDFFEILCSWVLGGLFINVRDKGVIFSL